MTPGAAFAGGKSVAVTDHHVRLCLCAIADPDRLTTALRIVAQVAPGADAGRMPVI